MAADQFHPELHPLLLEFHRISGHLLRAVWRVYADGCVDKIILEFDHTCLEIKAEPEDDTIAFHVVSGDHRNANTWTDASHTNPWREYMGKEFGWGWIIINQEDALDGILLSFSGITPQVMLVVVASSICESTIHRVC